MGWKEKWHPRGQNISGQLARGVGLSLHTWGGRGHASDCDLSIHPDGSVEIKMGTQDIGHWHAHLHRRSSPPILLACRSTHIKLYIGDTLYPPSGGSGGSTTTGGVSSSTRRAAVDARDALFAQGRARTQRPARRTRMRERHRQRQVRSQPFAELERGLCQDRRSHHRSWSHEQESRQEQARPHQQRRRRRADGGSRSRYRNRHRQSQEDGRGAGLRADHRREDSRKASVMAP